VLADDGSLVIVKGVSGEINHGAYANGAPLVSAMGGKLPLRATEVLHSPIWPYSKATAAIASRSSRR
jgi:hypothetical protein